MKYMQIKYMQKKQRIIHIYKNHTKMSYSYNKNELFIYYTYTKKWVIHIYKKRIYSYKEVIHEKKEVIHTKNELFIQQKWIIHILYIYKKRVIHIYT